jgi:hypothetical protein
VFWTICERFKDGDMCAAHDRLLTLEMPAVFTERRGGDREENLRRSGGLGVGSNEESAGKRWCVPPRHLRQDAQTAGRGNGRLRGVAINSKQQR